MNPLFGMMSNGPALLMQAFAAMMRGESPQAFMQNLAKNHPQLQGLDFGNMQSTAKTVCDQHGVDSDFLAKQLDQSVKSMTK